MVHEADVSFCSAIEFTHFNISESVQKLSPHIAAHTISNCQTHLMVPFSFSLLEEKVSLVNNSFPSLSFIPAIYTANVLKANRACAIGEEPQTRQESHRVLLEKHVQWLTNNTGLYLVLFICGRECSFQIIYYKDPFWEGRYLEGCVKLLKDYQIFIS